MKVYFFTILVAISSFSYAMGVENSSKEPSMKETISKVTAIVPVEDINITVFANTIAGPVEKLTTNSCIKAVQYIKPYIGDKAMLIMDGGYSLKIEKGDRKFHLSSHQENLFSWISRCEKNKSLEN